MSPTNETGPPEEGSLPVRRVRRRKRAVRREGGLRAGRGAILLLGIILLLSALSLVWTPHDPTAQNLGLRLVPPVWTSSGTWTHPLGTDYLGRDQLSRLMVGGRLTLAIGVGSVLVEAAIGISLGVVAGYRGGRIDAFVMRWADIQMGLPSVLLLMTIILITGPSVPMLIVAIAINGWMIFARVARGRVVELKSQGFVEAAHAAGLRDRLIVGQHILPHLRNDMIALAILETAQIILAESVISFVGIGVQPPSISWGLMLGGGRDYIPVASHLATIPGLAILFTVLSLNTISKWLEPILDRLRGETVARR